MCAKVNQVVCGAVKPKVGTGNSCPQTSPLMEFMGGRVKMQIKPEQFPQDIKVAQHFDSTSFRLMDPDVVNGDGCIRSCVGSKVTG